MAIGCKYASRSVSYSTSPVKLSERVYIKSISIVLSASAILIKPKESSFCASSLFVDFGCSLFFIFTVVIADILSVCCYSIGFTCLWQLPNRKLMTIIRRVRIMNFSAFYGAKITIYFVVKKLLPKSRAISSGFVRDFLRICAQFPP